MHIRVFPHIFGHFLQGAPRAILWRMLRHTHRSVLFLSLGVCVGVCALPGSAIARADQSLVRALAETNVNHQYLIESVSISGVEVAHFQDAKMSTSLRHRLAALVGSPCDMSAIGDLAGKLRATLHLQDVKQHLSRGSSPDRVRVDFEVVRPEFTYDLSVPRFLYASNQGWTTELNASAKFRQHSITVGLGSNGDDLAERFTGFSTRYENAHIFSDRIHFAFDFEGYHDQWNPETREAIAGPGGGSGVNESPVAASNAYSLYRTRRNIAPTLTFVLSKAVSVSVGASFEGMQMEAPSPTGNDMTSANAATAEIDFGYTAEGADVTQRWDSKYAVRVATRELGSDYVYRRQIFSLRYQWQSGRQTVTDRLMAGSISGQAPLFERFVLGNSSTLQGWDRYAIDPLGGDRMAHNCVSYGHEFQRSTAEVFYDAGYIGVGSSGQFGTLRHSVGVGFRQGIFNVAMAFPLNEGRVTPVFMAGMNY